jgi:hypothetical protein
VSFALLAIGALGCYFSHLSAFLFLGIVVAVLAGWRLRQAKPLLGTVLLLISLLPPIVLYGLVVRPEAQQAGGAIWNGVTAKIRALGWLGLSPVPTMDGLVLSGLLVAALLSVREGRGRWNGLGLSISGVLLLAFIAFPEILNDLWGVDRRFVVPAGLVFLCTMPLGALDSRPVLAALIVTLLAVRPVAVAFSWRTTGRAIAEQVELLKTVASDSSVCPLVFEVESGLRQYDVVAFRHVVHYATVERTAIVPTLFAGGGPEFARWPYSLQWRQMPVRASAFFRGASVSRAVLERVYREYDFLYVYGMDAALEDRLRRDCDLVGQRGRGALFDKCRWDRSVSTAGRVRRVHSIPTN